MGYNFNLKVTCDTNKDTNKDEYHFDYYDLSGHIVGSVIITELGAIKWYIWEHEYKENILNLVSILMGEKVENTTKYVIKGLINGYDRWDRAQDYIHSKGLVVNYLQEKKYNRFFKDGNGRKSK